MADTCEVFQHFKEERVCRPENDAANIYTWKMKSRRQRDGGGQAVRFMSELGAALTALRHTLRLISTCAK